MNDPLSTRLDDWLAQARQSVRATPLGRASLILHSARWAERRRTAAGRLAALSGTEILPGQPADIGAHNALLARYETAFEALMPPMHRIEAPGERLDRDPERERRREECSREAAQKIGRALGWDQPRIHAELESFEQERASFLHPRAVQPNDAKPGCLSTKSPIRTGLA